MYENRATFSDAGYDVELIDLRQYGEDLEDLRSKLASKDAVWLNGGNTFYLRWILQHSGADHVIAELVTAGLVYGGGSAGALVAGPTLKHIEEADEPSDAPELIWDGLHITETVVMPHMRNAEYGAILGRAAKALELEGYEVIGITDDQAVIIEDDKSRVVDK